LLFSKDGKNLRRHHLIELAAPGIFWQEITMNEVIKVENLGKLYRLGLTHHDLLSETLMHGARRLVKEAKRLFSRNGSDPTVTGMLHRSNADQPVQSPPEDGHVWALKNVSFRVKQGEVIGIIGRNGAGKSTLLKILSRITDPTEGRIVITGRVGSLLEVGTGFHPELTGKENVYLNGSILGMTRAEIRSKFDEIVSFAEVERFIDTPVKRYSSGMYVRLAFAVAAHLETEILLVDEVLAVGDTAFQKKCMGKMSDVAKQGRTILFVSHNMDSVNRLCTKGMLLGNGACECQSDVSSVIQQYLQTSRSVRSGFVDLRQESKNGGHGGVLTSVSTNRSDGTIASDFHTGESIIIKMGYELNGAISSPYFAVHFVDNLGRRIMTVNSLQSRGPFNPDREGIIECALQDIRLLTGDYSLDIAIGRSSPVSRPIEYVEGAININILLGDYLDGGRLLRHQGLIAQKSQWLVRSSSS